MSLTSLFPKIKQMARNIKKVPYIYAQFPITYVFWIYGLWIQKSVKLVSMMIIWHICMDTKITLMQRSLVWGRQIIRIRIHEYKYPDQNIVSPVQSPDIMRYIYLNAAKNTVYM